MKFNYQNSSLVSETDIKKTAESLIDYIKQISKNAEIVNYDFPESSVCLPDDEQLLKTCIAMRDKKVTAKLKYIIDIGIGGSNLGTKAVYDALFGYFDVIEPDRFPKMIFADTNDPEFLNKLQTFITKYIADPEEILINAISKSGGTTETISNLEIILQALESKFKDGKKRLVCTTDEGSKFMEAAKKYNVDCIGMPKSVGGRYSVLSAVGIFPMACAGIDVTALRTGALRSRQLCLSSDILNNPAAISAAILFLQSKNGKNINDNFIFHPELESVGKWYRQLMGESIGKEHDLNNAVVNAGITPTVSIGSTDLHSVGQLYLGGPKDKTTTFISTAKARSDVSLPGTLQFPLVSHLENKKASEIMEAIHQGVMIAYTNQKLPFMDVILDEVSETSIGEFFQFKMIEMMFLGKLFNVNTFDQPHVELYKTETKKFLSQS